SIPDDALVADNTVHLDPPDVPSVTAAVDFSDKELAALMRRAGAAVARAVDEASGEIVRDDGDMLREETAQASLKVVVLAGAGNNGGDGWVAAADLARAGYQVVLFTPKPAKDLRVEPARTEALRTTAELDGGTLSSLRVVVSPDGELLRGELEHADYVVDAMLGVGFSGCEMRQPFGEWASAVNEAHRAGAFVVAADVPSGLNAQTGAAAPGAVRADVTVTMIACKPGLLTSNAREHVGKLVCANLAAGVDGIADRMGIARRFSSMLEKNLLRDLADRIDRAVPAPLECAAPLERIGRFEEAVCESAYDRAPKKRPKAKAFSALLGGKGLAKGERESGRTRLDALEAEKPHSDLKDMLDRLDEPFSVALMDIIDARGLTDAQVYRRANMSRQLFSKIRSSRDYRPTKRTVLALAVALELTPSETRELLERAGFALSHANKVDVIVEFFLEKGVYDIFTINEALFAFDQPLL
ncbi:MAG: NAD(P)H-hydrate epimerase, partial [Eggerthellaceae bacterium]|nr:NAD(P)H-hydrate epimerase [Eggerthellaceae bacterium]